MAVAQAEQLEVRGPPLEHSLWEQPPEHSFEHALSACASETHWLSQLPLCVLQQYGSSPHTAPTQVLH